MIRDAAIRVTARFAVMNSVWVVKPIREFLDPGPVFFAGVGTHPYLKPRL